MTWPQPHEGITGTDQAGWLLSLDEQAIPHREALIAMARHLHAAVLVGDPVPAVRRMSERICHPEPGDLAVAVEVMYGRRDPDTRLRGFGILLARRKEWASTDAQWAAECLAENWDPATEERFTGNVYYLQYGPAAGDICRWHDSRPAGLPVQAESFSRDAAAGYSGTRVMFTRDSLAGSLADAGFTLLGQRGPLPDDGRHLVTVRVPGGEITEIRDDPAGDS
jgi:hypothetical protein